MAYDVFISYSTADLPIVQQIEDALRIPDVRVFIADHSLPFGASIPDALTGAIGQCDLFVLLWSRNSKESQWVQGELGIAIGKQKNILPIALDRNITLPPFIQHLKYFPAFDYPHDVLSWLNRHVFSAAEQQKKQTGALWLAGLIGLVVVAANQK